MELPFNLTYWDLLAHAAMVIFSVSYLFRDIFWLRLFSIIASTCEIAFFYFAPDRPIWTYIIWNGVFIAIHLYHLGRLAHERLARPLSADEGLLHQSLFSGLSRFEYLRLLSIAAWRTVGPEACLTVEGKRVKELILLYDGRAVVLKGGQRVGEITDGQFIGEMSFASGDPASATVITSRPSRYLVWSQADLRQLLDRNPSLAITMESVLSRDVVRKLARNYELGAET